MNFRARSASIAHRLAAVFLTTFFASGCGLLANAQNTIYTVAGGGLWNGTATGPNADLAAPSAVAKDSSGNLYIADPVANDVFKVDTLGNLTVFAGLGYPTEHALFANGKLAINSGLNGPAGVAADQKGNVYIADTLNYIIRQVSSKGTITAVAGNTKLCQDPTAPNACGDGATAKGAQLNYPVGVTTDSAGTVYIADTGDNKIRVVNLSGTTTITVAGVSIAPLTIQTVAGTGAPCGNPVAGNCGDNGPALSALLNNPQGVAVDSAGNIYISDSGDRRIRIVSPTGTINAYAGSGNPCFPRLGCGNPGPATSANLSNPWQIALDSSGNLFITDAPTNSVWEMNASTQTMAVVAGFGLPAFTGDGGKATSAKLNGTHGVAVDASNNVFIADSGNQRIREFTVSGNITTVAGGGNGNDGSVATSAILGGPRAAALDSAGNLYIADTFNNRIREVTPGDPPASYGTITTIAGTGIAGFAGDGGLATSAALNSPTAIAVDSANNVYVTDSGNFVIRKYTAATETIAVVAGKAQTPCNAFPCGDGGLAKSATFAKPTSIVLDSAGNIYVADAGTHSIRVVNTSSAPINIAGVSIPANSIQTVAGTNGTACTIATGPCGDGGLATAALLNAPFGVAVDGSGNIFIADTGDNRVRKVTATTGIITAYAYKGTTGFGPSGGPALTASYNTPHYLALDPRGDLFVSGSDFDYVVERIDGLSHTVIPVAGVATNPKFFGFAGDGGLATLAALNNSGVAVDGSGHLFIAEEPNNRVREVLTTPAATPSVTSLTFAAQTVGTTSPVQTFTLKNGGSDDLFITGKSITPPFQLKSTTCTNTNTVVPSGSCTFSVTFKPTAVGPVTGSITITDNAYGSPSQTVTLNGTGQ